jgi:uncharacterized membrane protein
MKTNNKDFSDRHLNNFSILVLAVAITMLTVVAANAQVDFNVLNELLGPTQTN